MKGEEAEESIDDPKANNAFAGLKGLMSPKS